MSADHLTAASPHHLATAIRAALTEADTAVVAAQHGLDPTELDAAVSVYHAGGMTALDQLAEHDWYDVRVEFTDWKTAETVGTTHLGPALDALHTAGAHTGWWFLRKHPCWRIRLHRADTTAVDRVLDNLTTTGHLARWWPTIYEPEMAAFGGITCLDVIHNLFCADTRGVLEHLRHDQPSLDRRELSVLLLTALFHGAGLDSFERGDVFHRVAQQRATPPDTYTAKIEQLAAALRPVLTLDDPARADLFDDAGPAAHALGWLMAFRDAGGQLGEAAASGHLGRGLRAILTHVVIFAWNRIGLSPTSQAVLARSAVAALLPDGR
jgi:thiopeptide-type bacteriocin biosynthesis protein